MNTDDRDDMQTMNLLNRIEQSEHVSQRVLAQQMGVALGVVNACIKRCVKKGLIKITQTPANRYSYFLTPTGFMEKARLTKQYVQHSFKLYRQVSDHYRLCFADLAERSGAEVIFLGLSDLAEIALLWSVQYGIPVLGIFDFNEGADERRHLNLEGLQDPETVPEGSWMVVTSLALNSDCMQTLQQRNPRRMVLLNLL